MITDWFIDDLIDWLKESGLSGSRQQLVYCGRLDSLDSGDNGLPLTVSTCIHTCTSTFHNTAGIFDEIDVVLCCLCVKNYCIGPLALMSVVIRAGNGSLRNVVWSDQSPTSLLPTGLALCGNLAASPSPFLPVHKQHLQEQRNCTQNMKTQKKERKKERKKELGFLRAQMHFYNIVRAVKLSGITHTHTHTHTPFSLWDQEVPDHWFSWWG